MGWYTQQIDYVLAFPQAPVEKEIYMKAPKGFKVTGKNADDYVLRLNKKWDNIRRLIIRIQRDPDMGI